MGLKKYGQREIIEYWMNKNNMMLLALQETKINKVGQNNRKDYMWYFGGNPDLKSPNTHHGVAIVINKKLKKSVNGSLERPTTIDFFSIPNR